jgi:hypothetical protein
MRLGNLTGNLAKAGLIAGATLFAVLLIRFFVQLGKHNPPRTASEHGTVFVHILITSVALVVVAIPEGSFTSFSTSYELTLLFSRLTSRRHPHPRIRHKVYGI